MTDDGGPAFPITAVFVNKEPPHSVERSSRCMSLRDYFAGQALVGLVANIPGPGCAAWDYYSVAAFHIADAMLAERSKSSSKE